jgi:hypothetical protein
VYEGPKDNIIQLLHFINRIITPILTLSTDEDIEKFLDFDKEWIEDTKFLGENPVLLGKEYTDRKTKTRVLAFIFDKEEYEDDIKGLKLAGKLLCKREELRIAMV